MPVTLDFRNTNSLWCSVLAETLARSGVTHAVCCPGSRSTPLTLALAAHPSIEAIPILDERSAAFFALGLAKRSGSPTVLVCTSGSAGANFLPAVIEARESRIPLIIITADRPPEMRECASGQTIDQQKLFGTHVLWYHEFASPEARIDRLAYLRQITAHACQRAVGYERGPVHLNAPFRDPLVPQEDGSARALHTVLAESDFAHLSPPESCRQAGGVLRFGTARGLIIAGTYAPTDEASYAYSLRSVASALGWPILADGLSPARRAELGDAVVVTTYDAILRNATQARDLLPKVVLCLGRWPTSKVLRAWLESSQAEIVLVSPGPANVDALHGRTRHVPLDPENLQVAAGSPRDLAYSAAWQSVERATRSHLDQTLADTTAPHEPKTAWLIARCLSPETFVFVANSMPVRDVEYVWPRLIGSPRVACNRGANGIDGNLSTALGLAHGKTPVVFLTGDLAFLHDSNALLSVPHFRGSLLIVLINNAGGGIFEHLPVAQYDPPFEKFFATPQQVNFALLAEAHGVSHTFVRDWTHFEALLSETARPGVRIVEIRTDRKADAAWRKSLFAKLAAGQS